MSGRGSTVLDGGQPGLSPREVDDDVLREIGRRRFDLTREASDRFFEARADDVSRACRDMARRFHRGGRLLVLGPEGPARSDAYHVSVEFVHPVLVGKRALPATVLDGEAAERIRILGRPRDIALGISRGERDADVVAGLRAAGERGLLTLGLTGGAGGGTGPFEALELDHRFAIRSDDPTVVQEVQETLYHVLWELVHVFFDHRELL